MHYAKENSSFFSNDAIMVSLSQHIQCKSLLFPTLICQHVIFGKGLLPTNGVGDQEYIDN